MVKWDSFIKNDGLHFNRYTYLFVAQFFTYQDDDAGKIKTHVSNSPKSIIFVIIMQFICLIEI